MAVKSLAVLRALRTTAAGETQTESLMAKWTTWTTAAALISLLDPRMEVSVMKTMSLPTKDLAMVQTPGPMQVLVS